MIQLHLNESKHGLDFNAQYRNISESIHESLCATWRESVREFVRVVSDNIHVDTGMTLATLEPIQQEFKTRALKYIFRRGEPPKLKYDPQGRYGYTGKMDKNISSGRTIGRKIYKVSYGTARSMGFKFTFKLGTLQYYIHENPEVETSDNWGTLDLGMNAFAAHWEKYAIKRLPMKSILKELVVKGIK